MKKSFLLNYCTWYSVVNTGMTPGACIRYPAWFISVSRIQVDKFVPLDGLDRRRSTSIRSKAAASDGSISFMVAFTTESPFLEIKHFSSSALSSLQYATAATASKGQMWFSGKWQLQAFLMHYFNQKAKNRFITNTDLNAQQNNTFAQSDFAWLFNTSNHTCTLLLLQPPLILCSNFFAELTAYRKAALLKFCVD